MTDRMLLDVSGLTVTFETAGGSLTALDSVDFHVEAGETLALVGESGSGKSTAAMAAVGLLGPEARITGSARISGRDMTRLAESERRKLRGREVSIVFQDPFTSLNPGLTIGEQVAEPLRYHFRVSAEEARERTVQALGEVGLPAPEALLTAYPHQLSGGMQQRVLIAGALICDPKLLILDEPTTALDVTIEARILDLLDEIRRRRRLGMLFITHNLGVVNRIADRVCVLYAGRVAELGNRAGVLGTAAHPYTKGLLASLPKLLANDGRDRLAPIPGRLPDMIEPPVGCIFQARCPFSEERCGRPQALIKVAPTLQARCWKADTLLGSPWPKAEATNQGKPMKPVEGGDVVASGLVKEFIGGRIGGIGWARKFGLPLPRPKRRTTRAVDGVSVRIEPGEVLGLVGESGSGKSTLGRLLLRLVDSDEGQIVFDGSDVTSLPERRLRAFRRRAQIVFQNPDSSLNPRKTVGEAVARAVKLHTDVPAAKRRAHVEALLDRVGLPSAFYTRYPHQLSGGEKQRVGIARALATRPNFILCDEPVSALDVSVQATVLNLLEDLRAEEGLAYLFISHDLSVVAHISDRIAVMYAGQIVETGNAREVLEPPYHPYTEALLSAIPHADPSVQQRERVTLRTDTVPTGQQVTGCPFHPRCPRKLGAICETTPPPVVHSTQGHALACHIPLGELVALPSAVPTTDGQGRNEQAEQG